ncbi:hypothetical protein [Nocardioides marmotae]|uniref:Histidine kinase n=1 Tax=Nocardioides marmotae TaxID=2663857 RepID=A0A6I3JEM4_9ACTN|nr:hypothetical protein [Nocardioides marmotae]MCR6032879.1 hypothetical protein [Gordonia jinghuaiqii]MBC9733408.1 hypothetical protein [Nocardioides marmotae]MTB84515.1 hypothetical protein [Nocardioides marmotae]MTB96529.1 hypothetical protein [Nocardioides marmotae]QKE01950.1 hypothetical protein HPC71_13380 [Nocardioides marmotae]
MTVLDRLGVREAAVAAPASSERDTQEPWFVRHQRRSLAVALGLFAAVTLLRFLSGADLTTGTTMLYVLPVSLLALSHGTAAGVAAGAAASAAVAVWSGVAQVDIGLVGWATRALPLVLAGYLLGDASDRLRRAAEQRLEHEAAALRHRQAVEVNDLLVQGMAVSKWSFEAGRTEAGLRALEETIETGQQLVSRLIKDADAGGRVMD